GIDATTGRLIYEMFDGTTGQVPVTVATPANPSLITPTFTSTVWRGADATTANNVIYVGDEGNQDSGEMNGQMRTYTDLGLGFGLITPDELAVNPEDYVSLDLRLVDIWPDA